jgi:cytochrome c oxidase assembly protein subunit 15
MNMSSPKTSAKVPKLGLRLLGIVVFTQAGIVVTGALVRLTGSGLGCPTWPRCTSESYFPQASQVEGLHKWIEFGNRLLTFVVALAAISSLIYILRHHFKVERFRSGFLFAAAFPLIGTIAQAILGGILVLIALNPFAVAAHFLLSILIVAIAARTRVLAQYPNAIEVKPKKLLLGRLLVLAGLLVIILGVVTTGTGPHAGDDVAERFNLDIEIVAWMHADAVWLFTGLLIANFIYNRSSQLIRIIGIVGTQIIVGYSQWFTDLPWILVSIHVALAITMWVLLVKYQTLIKQGVI